MRSRKQRGGKRGGKNGFTLVELMITVVILAIISVVAVVSYKKYMRRARTTEALNFLADIKMKQETYYGTYGQYVDTSVAEESFADSDFYPQNIGGGDKKWDIECPDDKDTYPGWCALGSRPTSGETNYQYVTVGWTADDGDPPAQYIQNPERRWWFAVARGDLDGNNVCSTFILTSERPEVAMFNETE